MYLTLPSDSSVKFYPNNTCAKFKVKLPYVLQLEGDYEVGLIRLQYINSYLNILEEESSFMTKTCRIETILVEGQITPFPSVPSIAYQVYKIEAGFYTSDELVSTINSCLTRDDLSRLEFNYNSITNRMT